MTVSPAYPVFWKVRLLKHAALRNRLRALPNICHRFGPVERSGNGAQIVRFWARVWALVVPGAAQHPRLIRAADSPAAAARAWGQTAGARCLCRRWAMSGTQGEGMPGYVAITCRKTRIVSSGPAPSWPARCA